MPYVDPEVRKEYNRQYQKKYQERYREKAREHSRNWYQNHKDEVTTKRREHYYLNREKEISRVMKGNVVRYRKNRLKVILHYGGDPPKCLCCGESQYRFLTIHHINNNGGEHRKELKTKNLRIAEYIIKNNYPNEYQILCYNCNCAIGFFGECPHQNV